MTSARASGTGKPSISPAGCQKYQDNQRRPTGSTFATSKRHIGDPGYSPNPPGKVRRKRPFGRIAGLSSGGDIRMILPAENRSKVGNIIQKHVPLLSYRPANGLPGVYRRNHRTSVAQDHFARRKVGPFAQTLAGVAEGCHFFTTTLTRRHRVLCTNFCQA